MQLNILGKMGREKNPGWGPCPPPFNKKSEEIPKAEEKRKKKETVWAKSGSRKKEGCTLRVWEGICPSCIGVPAKRMQGLRQATRGSFLPPPLLKRRVLDSGRKGKRDII